MGTLYMISTYLDWRMICLVGTVSGVSGMSVHDWWWPGSAMVWRAMSGRGAVTGVQLETPDMSGAGWSKLELADN